MPAGEGGATMITPERMGYTDKGDGRSRRAGAFSPLSFVLHANCDEAFVGDQTSG